MKKPFREICRVKTNELSVSRRKEASIAAMHSLTLLLDSHEYVLSFAPLKNEIDLWPLNTCLASFHKLLLPKVQDNQLEIYHVLDLEKDLVLSSWNIWEPNPETCQKASNWSAALVPGLAFDRKNNRLGYGKGFYDRFLLNHPQGQTIGVGFKEQFFSEIPTEKHDVPLREVLLF